MESEQPRTDAPLVRFPAGESELRLRLRIAIGDESQSAFARRSGVAESVLRKYLAGAQPSTDRLVAMADAANVSIEWLAAGRGPRVRQGAAGGFDDIERLTRAIEAVHEGIRGVGRVPEPARYARLVAAAYVMMASPATTGAQVTQFVRAAFE